MATDEHGLNENRSLRVKTVHVVVDSWWIFWLIGGAAWLLDLNGGAHVSWWVCAVVALAPMLLVAAFFLAFGVVLLGAMTGAAVLDYRDKRRRSKRRAVLVAEVEKAINEGTPIYRLSKEHQAVWRQSLAQRRRLSDKG